MAAEAMLYADAPPRCFGCLFFAAFATMLLSYAGDVTLILRRQVCCLRQIHEKRCDAFAARCRHAAWFCAMPLIFTLMMLHAQFSFLPAAAYGAPYAFIMILPPRDGQKSSVIAACHVAALWLIRCFIRWPDDRGYGAYQAYGASSAIAVEANVAGARIESVYAR